MTPSSNALPMLPVQMFEVEAVLLGANLVVNEASGERRDGMRTRGAQEALE